MIGNYCQNDLVFLPPEGQSPDDAGPVIVNGSTPSRKGEQPVLSEATRFLHIWIVHVRPRVLSRTSCRAASTRQSSSPSRSSRLLASRSRTRAIGFRQGRSRTPGWIDMAAPHEIRMLMDKEGNEAKAKCACQQKVYQHHFDMEILEAEFQW